MSVATLIGGALKTRQAGAREAQTASVELPEKLYPARVQLTAKLSEFERACSDLSEYQAKSARAERDEQEALDNAQLSEGQAADSISRAQNLKAVYSSRTANKEKAIAALSKELTSAIGQANSELQGLVNKEVDRRREILDARVLAAAGVADTTRPGVAPALADLMDYSEPIERIKALEPSALIQTAGNHEILVQTAKDVLMKFEKVTAEAATKV